MKTTSPPAAALGHSIGIAKRNPSGLGPELGDGGAVIPLRTMDQIRADREEKVARRRARTQRKKKRSRRTVEEIQADREEELARWRRLLEDGTYPTRAELLHSEHGHHAHRNQPAVRSPAGSRRSTRCGVRSGGRGGVGVLDPLLVGAVPGRSRRPGPPGYPWRPPRPPPTSWRCSWCRSAREAELTRSRSPGLTSSALLHVW